MMPMGFSGKVLRAFSSQGFKHYLGLERLLGEQLLAPWHSSNYTCCARFSDSAGSGLLSHLERGSWLGAG